MVLTNNVFIGTSAEQKPTFPAANWYFIEADTGQCYRVVGGVWMTVNGASVNNFSTANQVVPATTRTYITGTKVTVPSGKLRVGTVIRWTLSLTKTAAGTATSTYDIAVGTNGTVADTARVSFSKPAGTAVVDEGKVVIEAIVQSIGVAGVIAAEFTLVHNLSTTGHANVPCVVRNTISAGFDTTVANLFVGVCVTTGAADAITIKTVFTEVFNL